MAFSVPSPEQGRDRLSSVDVRLSRCQGAGVWRGVGSDFQTRCTDHARVLRAGPSAPSLVPSEQTSVGPAVHRPGRPHRASLAVACVIERVGFSRKVRYLTC